MSEMSPLEAIFVAALEQATPAARAAYLDEACAGQPELRARVDKLLAAHPKVGGFLEPEPPGQATGSFVSPAAVTASYHAPAGTPGTIIAGRYKLLQQIGEGGMGSVWMADQTEPVTRRVAVKLIRVERGQSKTLLSRFEAERQAIALMDHPHIAKLLDAGTTEAGAPYFVMELVKGIPLNDYCDTHKLSIPDRLQLFMQICSAVQHAHQKGIIHRDLKPSNILVESHDGKPVPKVIDFGLAKATTGLKLTEHTLFTGFGSVLGTPLYMAPEQASFNAVDVDTRADIYALGVILYELLTGTTPLTREAIKQAQLDEMLRLIREQEAPTPSSRLSASDSKPSVAANRQMEPQKLGRFVKGELDWIVLKALAKERERRYDTANGFAKDVERFLNHEPVTAGPVSAGYRLKKFVQRHRGQVIAASLVLFVLLAGIVGTTWGLLEALKQEAIALEAASEERQAKVREADRAEGERKAKLQAEAKRQEAERNLAFAKKGNEILGSVFAGLDPKQIAESGQPLQVILVEKLDKAVAQLEGESIGDPLVVAAMQNNLGVSLLGLGESGKAIVLLMKALSTRQAKLDPHHPDTLTVMDNLASAYRTAGKPDLALPLFEETFKLFKTTRGPDHPDTLISMNNLALAYLAAGKGNLALPLFEESFKLRKERFGFDHPNTLRSMNSLAGAYMDNGKLDLALPLFEETLNLRKAVLGLDHPDTLISMNCLALGYHAAGKLDQALPLFEKTLQVRKDKLGADHPATLKSMNNLALGYDAAGKLDQALPLFEKTLQVRKAKLGADHPDTLMSMNNLAGGYEDSGRLDLALPLWEETLKLQRAKLGPDHPNTLITLNNLGKTYCAANQGEKAAALFKEVVADRRKRAKPDDPSFAGLLAQVALHLSKCRQHAAAEEMLRESLAIREKWQPDAWTTFNTKSMLGGALLGQKKYAPAEPLLVKGYEGLKAREKTIPTTGDTRIPEALDRLVELYTATGKPDEAAKWRAERAKYPNADVKPATQK